MDRSYMPPYSLAIVKLSAKFLIFIMLLAGLNSTGAESLPLPRLWPHDCVMPSWTNINIEWKSTWDETLSANFDANDLKQAAATGNDPGNAKELGSNGWITVWAIAGPYTAPDIGSIELLNTVFDPERKVNIAWKTSTGIGLLPWRTQFTDMGRDKRVAYMRADIWSPKTQEAMLEMGSNDGVKAWLNEQVVHSNNVQRIFNDCQDRAPVLLREGWNPLLMKITQTNGPLEASLRIRARDGGEITGLRINTILSSEQVQRIRHIVLLEAMIHHFPQAKEKHPQAYADIAAEFTIIGDRTRLIQWHRKLIEDFPERKDLAASACYEILRYSHPFDYLPDAHAWVEFAARKAMELEKTSPESLNSLTIDLARRHPCMALVDEHRYVEARRYLDLMQAGSGSQSWWLLERADLMSKAGSIPQAAEMYTMAGNRPLAMNLLAQARKNPTDDAASHPSQELAMRWKAFQETLNTPGGSLLIEPANIQELLRLSAESWTMSDASADNRIQFWTLVDQVLRRAKPADLQPLRELEEKKAKAIAAELRRTGDFDGMMRMFRRYPWAQSSHELLMEFGEKALLNQHYNMAMRCFQDVITYAADQELQTQACTGLWLTLVQEPCSRNELVAAMATVPDSAALLWRGTRVQAGDFKKIILDMIRLEATATPDLAGLKRRQLVLPGELAGNNPGSYHPLLAPWSLGPWAINRLIAEGDQLTVIGPQTVASFGPDSKSPRWFSTAPKLYIPDHNGEGDASPNNACRPVSIGSSRTPALGAYRGAHTMGTASMSAIFMLVSSPAGNNSVTYHLAAIDAGSGRALWNSRDNPEWNDLSPMNTPTASDGRVYAVALGPAVRLHRPMYLICMSMEDGAIVWKRRMGAVNPAEHNSYELALAGSPVTIHQGSIYVATDLGIAGRFDVRDGMTEWVQAYPESAGNAMLSLKFKREGSSPLIAGDKVIAIPRGHSGALAFQRDTGRVLWEAPLVPSDQISGVSGDAVILTAGREISALDLNSGRELWHVTPDQSADVQAIVAGQDLLALAGGRLLRVNVSTGKEAATVSIVKSPGSEVVLLNDGSLAEIAEEPPPVPAEKIATSPSSISLPVTETWRLPCENPMLTWPIPGNGPSNTFGVLAGRSILCVRTQPNYELVWQRRLRIPQNSLGIHGNLMLAAHDQSLTAFDMTDGATKWTLRLPLNADFVCGNDQVIIAGQKSAEGIVAAIDPSKGIVIWSRWFGKEVSFTGRTMKWITLQKDTSGASFVRLYWGQSPAATDGSQLLEADVDVRTGLAGDIRAFLPDEQNWPVFIAFGDDLRCKRGDHAQVPWTRHGPFLPDAMSYVGTGTVAHVAMRTPAADLAPGWAPVMDVKPESQYLQTVSIHPTAAGPFIRRVGQLEFRDISTNTVRIYSLPRNIPMRTAYDILDFSQSTGTVMVVSGSRSAPAGGGNDPYAWNGLQDCTGMGNVSIKCFTGQAQIGHSTMQLPEAGVNPVATLLNGRVKQHYQGSQIHMTGISSLGWSKFDVFFYGFSGSGNIDGGQPETCTSADYSKTINRTTFIRGTNYMKFAGVSGDAFTLNFGQCDFAAVQIVNSSPAATKDKPEGIGINWTGGGQGLLPGDVVGAEVVHSNWYNVNQFNVLWGGPTNTARGVSGVCLDVFNRETAELIQSGTLPGAPVSANSATHGNSATVLDNSIITTDSKGIRVYRSAGQ